MQGADLLFGARADEGVCGEGRVHFDEARRLRARRLHHLQVPHRLHADVGDAPLLPAVEVARAALCEVEFRELEAVLRGGERFEASDGVP